MTKIAIKDVQVLAAIVDASFEHRQVYWITTKGIHFKGVARSIDGGAQGGFLRASDNIYAGHLRVTTTQGLEVWLSIPEIMEMVGDDRFVISGGGLFGAA